MKHSGGAEQSDAHQIQHHYEKQWQSKAIGTKWNSGPANELPQDFSVLTFAPSKRRFWTYATCCMSQASDESRIELHLFSPRESRDHVELLTVMAHYHRTGSRLGLGHTVNFGRPWLDDSPCDHGLISLPYLDGPELENLDSPNGPIRFLWLIPVTRSEVEFAEKNGLEELERRFDDRQFNYLDPARAAVA
jgi:hypothetical protein